MVYIINTIIRKAIENPKFAASLKNATMNDVWKNNFLEPNDFN